MTTRRKDSFLKLALRFCPPDTRDEVRRTFDQGREKLGGSDVGVFLFAVTLLATAFRHDDLGSARPAAGKETNDVG